MKTVVSTLLLLLFSLALKAQEPVPAPVFDIPRIDRTVPDTGEWTAEGFRVELMPDRSGRLKEVDDFDAVFRLGWNEHGLWIRADIRDDVVSEAADMDMLWAKDGVEFFMARAPGAEHYYQAMISPGIDPAQPQPRIAFNPKLTAPIPFGDLAVQVARRPVPGGYAIEILAPWTNLGFQPAAGDTVAFQLMIDESDGLRKDNYYAIWFPKDNTSRDAASMYTLRLIDGPATPPWGFGASAVYERFSVIRVDAIGGISRAGQVLTVQQNGQEVARAVLAKVRGRAAAEIELPMPAPGTPGKPLEIVCDGVPMKTISLPPADVLRTETFVRERIVFQPFCFQSRKFPEPEFENPDLVYKLIGPYTLSTEFYNRVGDRVATADTTGRYGAVVTIHHGAGLISRRFATLFRMEINTRYKLRRLQGDNFPATLELPSEAGLPAAALAAGKDQIGRYAAQLFANALNNDQAAAVLLAGLADLAEQPEAEGIFGDVQCLDRQWWVGFKREYYGMDRAFPEPFPGPRSLSGAPAPVLRDGSPAEAGMQPGAVEAIEAVCREWATDEDQGFNMCIVRNRIVFLNRGFGTIDGEPYTADTSRGIASTTKFLSAILFMQLVDQGLVKLDDTVEQYLPALRNVKVTRKMTLRDLYMHTTGFPGQHWGDFDNDLEEIIADYYPALKVGVKQSYQGTGIAMAGKIVEMISGESVPLFFRRHLLDPLGCTHTEAVTTGAGAFSTGRDLAVIGQMMLNAGAYENQRFLKPETVAMMMPQPGNDRIGPDPSIRWGIGSKVYDSDGFSPQAFGHSGGNGAFLFIDPAVGLVIGHGRDRSGKDYEAYRVRFFKTVIEGIERER